MLSRTPRPSHRSLSSRTRAPPLSNAPHYRSLDTAHPRPRLQSLSSRTRDPASVCLLSRTSRPRHCPTRPVTVCLIPRIRATATPPLFAFFAHPRPRHHSLSSRTRAPANVCFLRAFATPPLFNLPPLPFACYRAPVPPTPVAVFADPRHRQRLLSSSTFECLL